MIQYIPCTFSWRTCLLSNTFLVLSAGEHVYDPIHFLYFQLENMFMIGSPLSVFLALRGIRSEGSGDLQHIMPKHLCSRLFNVYHPYDPVVCHIVGALKKVLLMQYTQATRGCNFMNKQLPKI